MKKLIGFIVVALIMMLAVAQGQEELTDLQVNPALYGKVKNGNRGTTLIYLIDTLQVPFQDDFSIIRQKIFDADENDTNLTSIFWEHYNLNGNYVDTLKFMHNVSYSYDYNFQNQNYDSFPNAQFLVDIYNVLYPYGLDTSFLKWPAQSVYAKGNNVVIVNLSPDSILYNQRDTITVVPDDGYSYYIDRDAFINTTYAIDPPTIGIATFDGLDSTGYPYKFSAQQSSSDLADKLTSKPFELNSVMTNVWFSFFYQPEGHGNSPETRDSLTLEFFAPSENTWYWAWSVTGEANKPFEQVFENITDAKFLQPGFRFRFKNYATLSGALDHWHIDYVRLGENRSSGDVIDDVAFQYSPPSFIKDYTAMPWNHYASPHMVTTLKEEMNNTSTSNKFVNNQYEVFDANDVSLYTSVTINNPSAIAGTPFVMTHSVGFSFPAMPAKTKFRIEHTTNTTPDANGDNDTISNLQTFDTYYALDDGTAEKGYSLVGPGAKAAMEFDSKQADTLQGVLMYFPPMLEDVTLRPLRISVWNSVNGVPEQIPIYQSNLVNPTYTTPLNYYKFYEISDTALILNGKFFIGWQQVYADKVYVGFDQNIDNSDKIWYNTAGTWNNTAFTGSLMIRPCFGIPEEFPIAVKEVVSKMPILNVYPNPAMDQLHINWVGSENATVGIIDISGRTVKMVQWRPGVPVDVSDISSGAYILRLQEAGGQVAVTRFIKAQ